MLSVRQRSHNINTPTKRDRFLVTSLTAATLLMMATFIWLRWKQHKNEIYLGQKAWAETPEVDFPMFILAIPLLGGLGCATLLCMHLAGSGSSKNIK